MYGVASWIKMMKHTYTIINNDIDPLIVYCTVSSVTITQRKNYWAKTMEKQQNIGQISLIKIRQVARCFPSRFKYAMTHLWRKEFHQIKDWNLQITFSLNHGERSSITIIQRLKQNLLPMREKFSRVGYKITNKNAQNTLY